MPRSGLSPGSARWQRTSATGRLRALAPTLAAAALLSSLLGALWAPASAAAHVAAQGEALATRATMPPGGPGAGTEPEGQAMPAAATAAAVAHDEDIATEAAAVPPEDVAAIARSLNCPLCQGYNLQDCPLEVCAQMRELIRFRLAEGQTREQIVAAFVADYGPQVLNEPPRRGFFLGAWVLPLVALALGVAGVALYVRRNIAEPEAATESESAAAPAALDESMAGYALELERMIERDEQ